MDYPVEIWWKRGIPHDVCWYLNLLKITFSEIGTANWLFNLEGHLESQT